MSVTKINRVFFTYSANPQSWVCPPGVKYILVTGCGGGGGGASGGGSYSSTYPDTTMAGGGEPALTSTYLIPVKPGETYTITTGSGGAGAIGSTNITLGTFKWGATGSDGGHSTFFGNSINMFFRGGAGGIFASLLATTVDSELRRFLIVNNKAVGSDPTLDGASYFTAGGRGGRSGGASNYGISTGGAGGKGANDSINNSSGNAQPGLPGRYGGGGGGGGSGTCATTTTDVNKHSGADGGAGGNGFVEIILIQ